MYRILLVFNNSELLHELQQLDVWGDTTGFFIADVVRDGNEAYRKLKDGQYDLLITEVRIVGMDGLQLLRAVKKEGLCVHVVLCSEFSDFDAARQGIILGAYDYLVKPFEKEQLLLLFKRIEDECHEHAAAEDGYVNQILELFYLRDDGVYGYIEEITDKIYQGASGYLEADKRMYRIYKSVIDEIYDDYEWLDLYLLQQDFYLLDGIREGNSESYKRFYKENLCRLFETVCELYPLVTHEQIKEILLYILNNPESDLSQKSLAERMHMNVSFLSTLFGTHTEIHFVNYLMNIRILRAAYLLANTDFKVSDIAIRLQYKDSAYFSRLFKQKFQMTPSEYKNLNSNLDFQI